jgi:hypothetical protein
MTDYQFNPEIEVWKAIPDFPGYEVSDHGRVRSYWRLKGVGLGFFVANEPQRILKPGTDIRGYHFVFLGKGNIQRVHRLVLLAFIGPCPPGKPEGCHNDGIPLNNHLPNLRWDSHKENHQDRLIHGTSNKGTKSGQSKLDDSKITKIRQFREEGFTQDAIAILFNVSQSTISHILHGKVWTHVP